MTSRTRQLRLLVPTKRKEQAGRGSGHDTLLVSWTPDPTTRGSAQDIERTTPRRAMYTHTYLLFLSASISAHAALILDPRPTRTTSFSSIVSNGRTPKPTAPPKFPLVRRADPEVSTCGVLEGDAPGSVKVCDSASVCIPFNGVVTSSWIFACCAYSDESDCETTAVACLGWDDNDLPAGQSTSQILNNTLLWYAKNVKSMRLTRTSWIYMLTGIASSGDTESVCLDAALVLNFETDNLTATSYYCGTATTTTIVSTRTTLEYTFVTDDPDQSTTPVSLLSVSTDIFTSISAGNQSASGSGPPVSITSAPSTTVAPSSNQTTFSRSSSTPAIVGGVVGGAAAIALVALVWYISRKRQARREAVWNPGGGKLDGKNSHYGPPVSELILSDLYAESLAEVKGKRRLRGANFLIGTSTRGDASCARH
nr:hypothetical protein CFP56_68378 [Quercus suber]